MLDSLHRHGLNKTPNNANSCSHTTHSQTHFKFLWKDREKKRCNQTVSIQFVASQWQTNVIWNKVMSGQQIICFWSFFYSFMHHYFYDYCVYSKQYGFTVLKEIIHFSESNNGIFASSKWFSLHECWTMIFTLAHHFTIAFWWEDCDKLMLCSKKKKSSCITKMTMMIASTSERKW